MNNSLAGSWTARYHFWRPGRVDVGDVTPLGDDGNMMEHCWYGHGSPKPVEMMKVQHVSDAMYTGQKTFLSENRLYGRSGACVCAHPWEFVINVIHRKQRFGHPRVQLTSVWKTWFDLKYFDSFVLLWYANNKDGRMWPAEAKDVPYSTKDKVLSQVWIPMHESNEIHVHPMAKESKVQGYA